MKISNSEDGIKNISIELSETNESDLSFQGPTSISTKCNASGVVFPAMQIGLQGDIEFNARPTVGGLPVALTDDSTVALQSKEITVVDNVVTSIPLCPVNNLVTVLYAVSGDFSEQGIISIFGSNSVYEVSSERMSLYGHYAPISFSVRDQSNSLVLDISGEGIGSILTFKYRVNSVNTLYS